MSAHVPSQAEANRLRRQALRMLRESGWLGPAECVVRYCNGALEIVARPAACPLDSPASAGPAAPAEGGADAAARKLQQWAADRVAAGT